MIGKLASSTTATIAISLVVLIGMYILYRDMKKLEVSIEKLQTRSACAKVLATPPVSVIEEDETTKRKRKRKKTTKRRRRRRRRSDHYSGR
jgi:hypothetical protein